MTFYVVGGLLLMIGVVSVLHARREQRRHEAWCTSAAKAQGVVSRIGRRYWLSRNQPSTGDRVDRVPVVKFRAANGVEYEFDAHDAPSTQGAAVHVAYDASSPSTAVVLNRRPKYGCAGVLMVLGAGMIVWELVQRY
jgi:hypothetical protein